VKLLYGTMVAGVPARIIGDTRKEKET